MTGEIITLNVIPEGPPPMVHCVQYDVGRKIRIKLLDGQVAFNVAKEDFTYSVSGTKPNGTAFSYPDAIRISNGELIFSTTKDMTSVPGAVRCTIDLYRSGVSIATLPFIMIVLEAGYKDGSLISANDTNQATAIYGSADGWLYRLTRRGYLFEADSTWKDLPRDCDGGIFENIVYSDTKVLQRITSTDGNGFVWTRWVLLNQNDASPWVGGPHNKREWKILVVGDSVAYGARNRIHIPYPNDGVGTYIYKGFAGDLMPDLDDYEDPERYFRNHAYGGATLSSLGGTGGMIANQLSSAESDGWVPDIIIAGTGTNDYPNNYALGTIPTTTRSSEPSSAEQETAMGGLETLFYRMTTIYPNAKRIFVTEHRVGDPNGTSYPPDTPNTQGYTQTDLTNAILQVCKLYGVVVADVFHESPLDTKFDSYIINGYMDDVDHPLEKGYWHFYLPLVRDAIERAYASALPGRIT